MDRRTFLAGITAGPLAAPLAADAQPAAKVWRIGYRSRGPRRQHPAYVDALRQGLGDLGWVEGRNIVIESRFAEGKTISSRGSRPSSLRSRST